MSLAPLRPLPPVSTLTGSQAGPALGQHDTANTSSSSASPTGGQRVPKKNATTACEGCKLSKRKCDQQQPCSNCLANNRACVYDPLQDGRRKQVRKRRLEELELRSQALDKILVILKNSPSLDARKLVDLIRRDAPLEEILEWIDAHPGDIANATRAALSASPPPEDVKARRPLTISEIVDNPTFKVSAAPWTTVTNDDSFVSHLISVYINWYHFYYHNFDETLFLDAMNSGNLNSTYCSPFLVNAVLCMACFFSDHPSAFATPGDTSSRGLHFYNEAYRLWILEAAKPTLTNVQAFTIMTMVAAFIGKDRVSTLSLKQLDVMLPQLLRRYPTSPTVPPISEDLQRSLKIADWAALVYKTGFGVGFMFPPSSPKPSLEAPYAGGRWHSHLTLWSPYPLLHSPVRVPLHALYHHMCEMYLMLADVQSLVFSDFANMNAVEKLKAAEEMDQQLMDWYKSIPTRFQAEDPNCILVPTTIDLALTLHHFRLIMWNWTIPPPPKDSIPSVENEHGSANEASPDLHSLSQTKLDDVTRKAKAMGLEIASITTEIHQKSDAIYGPSRFTVLTPQSGIYVASFLLSGNLNSEYEEEMLLKVMRLLVRCARHRVLVKGITQMLLKSAEDKVAANVNGEVPPGGVSSALLAELTVIVKDLAWEKQDHLMFSSSYPNYTAMKETQDLDMDRLLEKWATMALNDENEDGETASGEEVTGKGKERAG